MNSVICWGALLIPIITSVVLLLKWERRVKWWEFLILFAITPLLIWPLSATFGYFQARDTEYWTGWVTRAVYEEAWTEQYTYTTTDSKGNTTTHTGYRYHPPCWTAFDNNGCSLDISSSRFEWFCSHFGNRKFEARFNFGQCSFGDGNAYSTQFGGGDERMVVMTTTHSYTNKVAATNSIRSYPKITDKTGLFEYPRGDDFEVWSILGDVRYTEANRRLCLWNAKLGHEKQVRMWLLIFHDEPLMRAIDQESLWQGGNKNELVLCVGLGDGDVVNWAYAFSWTEETRLVADARLLALDQKVFNPIKTVDSLAEMVQKDWKRKQFAEYDYIRVPLPGWCILLTYFLVSLANIGAAWWIVVNQHHSEQSKWMSDSRVRRFA